MQHRRVLTLVGTAVVLLFAVGGWLWVRARHSVQTTETAVLDLRERSVARGQNQSDTAQPPLEIPRTTKHLVLDLPIWSKEGPYDIGLITNSGAELLRATGTAGLRDHINRLRVDVDFSSIRSGAILSAFESLISNGLVIPSACFDLYVPQAVRDFELQNSFGRAHFGW
jgi:hypothetical protein